MIKICFVCHGNICRSPMAEFIMKSLVEKEGRANEFFIESKATHTDEIWNGVGSHIYPPAQKELKRNGIPFDKSKRAVLLDEGDCDKYDLFIGMDFENIRFMNRILGKKAEPKIHKLLEYTGSDGDVYDPWYSDNFELAYNSIYKGCKTLLETL
ncbi:MAG: low molecular weight phosphotyrosine protein phosphatase [Eubacterium sp.]|nr:low molecular weight phosphotyrosine protein phosphatase [Eubacterium sp.]MBR7061333.1 low molecular weight phosphotyrosine protein phosphatase [Eubacterium sp.]